MGGSDVRFYLGTHKPDWLALGAFESVPLFVSRRRLVERRTLPRALGPWALDSGGFTELTLHGRWTVSPAAYVADVRRFVRDVGRLEWAAPQDWMCEAPMLQKTGLSVDEHQRRTVANFLELRDLAPELPFVPVLQGWQMADYWRHVDLYGAVGVELAALPLVGVGTLCRRQGTDEAVRVLSTLAAGGIRLHGFGFKVQGLRRCAGLLASADSMAWSVHARRRSPIAGHEYPGEGRRTGHRNCANCAEYALWWRRTMIQEGARA
jgi:hypothetical protein